jgi:uncharacterized membrane protein
VQAADPGDLDARLGEYRESALSRRQDRIRSSVSVVVCTLDVVALGLIAGQAHGLVRQIVGVAFCLVVPGWAIVGQLRLHNVPLEAGLVVAVSLASLLVVAQLAITFNAWHLTAVDVVVCVACLPSLVWQATAARRLRAPT